ncbi:hypothetical protein [Actinomadura rudentiformis]|uniref:Uncharacterized protein n=1 Tax=Actinomadura rudentiformis TaxID=359158 RepID=A0A6H9YIJ5_9ACTN|nr:hypothetical protein [Actinomadura rudentiformis]KAB2342376.1 hypothetical protein F8566_38105 [Actinomadura rudentiformis]
MMNAKTHEGSGRWGEQRRKSQARRAERLQKMDAELERRLPARYARQRNRRIVASMGAGLLGLLWVDAAISWALAPSDTAMIANFVILGVLVVLGFPVAGQLIAITRGMIFKREHELDERQQLARLRAFSTAHKGTTTLIILATAATMFADGDDDLHVPSAALFLILFALLVTHALLPQVVATWQMPDPPAEDDEDLANANAGHTA